jgi:shikimate kinase
MEQPKPNIFLIGPMGVGKTTIGRHLARSLGLEFIDSDHVIEEKSGADIPWIFDIEGEAGFRRRERAAIEELTRRHGIVLATGGGAVLDRDNRADLDRHGTVVYLQASVDKILARTGKSRYRPLLQTVDPRARVEQILAEREPLYREIADIIVDTDRRGIRSTVNFILRHLSGDGPASHSGRARGPGKRVSQARGARP